jgi:hypothetical protein
MIPIIFLTICKLVSTQVLLLTEDSDPSFNPTGFIEGLPIYIRPKEKVTGTDLGQFLL